MDHQLDDSLNLDGAMGVEFGHSSDVVDGQAIITLEHNEQLEGMPMEFENSEEQPMLVETGCEETIGLMGEEYTLSTSTEYSQETVSQPSVTESHHSDILTESMMDIQFEPQTLITSTPTTSAPTQRVAIKIPRATATLPRQVAIAPKPSPVVKKQVVISGGKQYTIAPKPVSLTAVSRPPGTVKKVTLAGVMQGQKSGQTVIAQIGKQLVMMPAGSAQKIKLVQAAGQPIQAQLITTKMAKVIMQTQSSNAADQPAVISKLTPTGDSSSPRFVTMQQKTVPISKVGKFIMGSPTNTGLRFSRPKQHIVSVKSSPSKILPAQKASTQKIVVTNPLRNVVLKTTIPHKATQIVKSEPNVLNVSSGQTSQVHQVNGIQYIRLVTNPSSSGTKVSSASAVKSSAQVVNMPQKTILLTDSKGNIIQMSADKMSGNQPPPLLVTSGAGQKGTKPQQKLVRIAPVMKTAQTSATNASAARPGQSLLAPISASDGPPSPPSPPPSTVAAAPTSHSDSKDALRALIESTVGDVTLSPIADAGDGNIGTHEVEVEFERQQLTALDEIKKRKCSPESEENSNSSQRAHQQANCKVEEHPLIVIPSSYVNQQEQSYAEVRENRSNENNEQQYSINEFIHLNPEMNAYQQSATPPPDNDFDRPRKACNCTKSQCLKLYCDCFANGEFCNRCNCTNCHNNLENEELRQKAIRGCLDRNPNAFRPKIGKSRTGGPETVRRHNKGCNCKRSGCLKNYCECYEAKIACTAICKCVGCRNVEEALERLLRRREGAERRDQLDAAVYRPPPPQHLKQPCSFMTTEVIEAVCQCLIAAAAEGENSSDSSEVPKPEECDPVKSVIEEFARCLQDIISASHQGPALTAGEEAAV